MRNLTFGKITTCLLCGLIIVVKLITISVIGFFVLSVSQVMMYPGFCEVRGLDINLHDDYDRVIRTMGEPHKREIYKRDNLSNLHALHYNDVVFLMSGERGRVVYIDLISEQFTLGGPMWRRIGVGSTREEVEYDFERKCANAIRWADRPVGYRKYYEPRSLTNAELGFTSTHFWTFAEFEFDENDIVTRIRIGVAV